MVRLMKSHVSSDSLNSDSVCQHVLDKYKDAPKYHIEPPSIQDCKADLVAGGTSCSCHGTLSFLRTA